MSARRANRRGAGRARARPWYSLGLEPAPEPPLTSPPLLSRLGWPRPATPIHGHEVLSVDLGGLGPVRLARWLHPGAGEDRAALEAARVATLQRHLAPGDVALVIG